MNTPVDQPREGRLIEDARERLGLSQNEAARQAGMSGTRWRQIVNREAPQMTTRRGVRTLARMAQAVGVTASRFRDVGREDVAGQLSDEDGGDLTPEEIALIERIRSDPRKRARLLDALLAASGHLAESTDAGEYEPPGHRKLS